MATTPTYPSRGLVNLVAEIETRLTGSGLGPGLETSIGSLIPDAPTYVLVVFDGLGVAQLRHPAADRLAESMEATLEAPFPTTTSVSLATIATGMTPSAHGLIGHLVWLEDLGRVVNTLKWVDLSGKPVRAEYGAFLPGPNLWERLRRQGLEPITVQPGAFAGSPLSRLLYRGARFESAWDHQDLIDATVALASEPGRLILTYVWQVDFAGHVHGLESPEMTDAVRLASDVWEQLVSGLPPGAVLLGTADHGLIEYDEEDKLLIREPPFSGLRCAGDPRGLHLWGDVGVMEDLAAHTGGELLDPFPLIGPDPTPDSVSRAGRKLLLAPKGKVILPPGFDKRLRAYHGGIEPEERDIPLLVG